MVLLQLIVWAPVVLAIVIATAVRLLALRSLPALDGRLALLTLLAGGIPALVVTVLRIAGMRLPPSLILDSRFQALLPLALGIVGVVLLMLRAPSPRTPSSAQVSRRALLTFVAPRWIVGVLALTALILALTITAGSASKRDAEGRYTAYWIELGTTGTSMGTEIYGWYYSLPAIAVLAGLLAATAIAWWLIPRPAWNDDLVLDTAVRRLRAANIGRVASGALLVHLAFVLGSLSGTARLTGSGPTTELGTVSAVTPFAALGPALSWGSGIALAAGLTLWIFTALTAAPIGSRRLMRAPAA